MCARSPQRSARPACTNASNRARNTTFTAFLVQPSAGPITPEQLEHAYHALLPRVLRPVRTTLLDALPRNALRHGAPARWVARAPGAPPQVARPGGNINRGYSFPSPRFHACGRTHSPWLTPLTRKPPPFYANEFPGVSLVSIAPATAGMGLTRLWDRGVMERRWCARDATSVPKQPHRCRVKRLRSAGPSRIFCGPSP